MYGMRGFAPLPLINRNHYKRPTTHATHPPNQSTIMFHHPATFDFPPLPRLAARPHGMADPLAKRRAAEEAAAERRQHAMEGRSMIHLQAAERCRKMGGTMDGWWVSC